MCACVCYVLCVCVCVCYCCVVAVLCVLLFTFVVVFNVFVHGVVECVVVVVVLFCSFSVCGVGACFVDVL